MYANFVKLNLFVKWERKGFPEMYIHKFTFLEKIVRYIYKKTTTHLTLMKYFIS